MNLLQAFRTGLFFSRQSKKKKKKKKKKTLMSLVVCVRYVLSFCSDKYIKMCIYAHIFIMHMFVWVWYMDQNVHAYVYVKTWTC